MDAEDIKNQESVMTVSRLFSLVVITPESLSSLPFVPAGLKKVAAAKKRFRLFLESSVEREKNNVAQGVHDSDNLTRVLVENMHGDESRGKLTDREVVGNLFIFNFAGQESTSGTMSFSMLHLAAYPEYQAWIAEEIHEVLGSDSPGALDYDAAFPRLKRVLAVMVSAVTPTSSREI